MWSHFEGKARSREESLAYLATLKWTDWSPQGITLHNTAAPTLKQWAESGPAHDARIRNLQSYYESELGWHAGPHFFVSRNWINWFSNPLLPGVHSRCFNATRFGIEMVGDYNVEEFNSGDGAMVRDNSVFLTAALNNRFGFKPEALTFHVECKQDNHDCPGRKVVKAEVIAAVKAEMARQSSAGATHTVIEPALQTPAPELKPAPEPLAPRQISFHVEGKMSTFGGPRDTGVSPSEGLALYSGAEQMIQHLGADWVLSVSLAGASGIARRINPDKPYLACRWPTDRYGFLRDAVVWVQNAAGKSVAARAVDWGPNAKTGRVADLSPGLAKALGLDTDDRCSVTVYEDGK